MGAIETMLGLLAQGPPGANPQGGLLGPQYAAPAPPNVPLPPPQAAPMPQVTAPPQPSMIQRITDRLSGIGKMDAPQGYDGLLSPDEIQKAQPGFMARLASITPGVATPGEQYQGNLNNIVKMKALASAAAEHKRIMDFRRSVATEPSIPEDAPIEKIRTHLARLYDRAAAAGDTEMMKDYGARLTGLFALAKTDPNKVVAPGGALIGPHGEVLFQADPTDKVPHIVNTQEGVFEQRPDGLYHAGTDKKWTGGVLHPVTPPGFTTIQDYSGDANAPPQTLPFNLRTGQPGAPIATGKPAATRIEGAQQELTRARAEAAVSEMNNATSNMTAYEEKLANGTADISGLGQFMGSVANTFTHDDPASKAIQSGALALLNRKNPDLARYIRRGLSFAEGESMISTRPSDFRTRMAAFLSQAASGAGPDMITDIQSRRASIMNPLNRIYTKPASGAAPASNGKQTITKDQADFLKTKKGMTQADIDRRYTVKP